MPEQPEHDQPTEVLEEIFNQPSDRLTPSMGFTQRVQAYFRQPGVFDRWLVGSILFFGIGGLLFSVGYFRYQIVKPYLPVTNQPTALAVDETEPDLLGLRQRDTDQDGLNDYDELNVYHTSPYLEDSDSDGLSDKLEITRASDPQCPAGKNCFYRELYTVNASSTASVNTAGSVENLRQQLRQAGISEEALAALSDDDIIRAYQQAIAGDTSSLVDQPTDAAVVDQLEGLTPTELRQLLSDAGMPAEMLEQVSDANLLDLARITLQQLQ